jgi:hypothetical protein
MCYYLTINYQTFPEEHEIQFEYLETQDVIWYFQIAACNIKKVQFKYLNTQMKLCYILSYLQNNYNSLEFQHLLQGKVLNINFLNYNSK